MCLFCPSTPLLHSSTPASHQQEGLPTSARFCSVLSRRNSKGPPALYLHCKDVPRQQEEGDGGGWRRRDRWSNTAPMWEDREKRTRGGLCFVSLPVWISFAQFRITSILRRNQITFTSDKLVLSNHLNLELPFIIHPVSNCFSLRKTRNTHTRKEWIDVWHEWSTKAERWL